LGCGDVARGFGCFACGALVVALTVLAFSCIFIGLVRFVFGCLPTALAFPCILIGLVRFVFDCLPTALAFPCILIGLVRFVFGCLPTALAFPCILIGLLASPLCGAALTFFAAA
jgi:hypothetical protein